MVEKSLMARRRGESDRGPKTEFGSKCVVALLRYSPAVFCTRRANCIYMYRDWTLTRSQAEGVYGSL